MNADRLNRGTRRSHPTIRSLFCRLFWPGRHIRRAIAETLAPGSSASVTTFALNSSDQRRRSCRGAPSRRSATASIIRKVLVPELGADIEAHIRSQTQQPIADRPPTPPDGSPCRLPPRGLINSVRIGPEKLDRTGSVLYLHQERRDQNWRLEASFSDAVYQR